MSAPIDIKAGFPEFNSMMKEVEKILSLEQTMIEYQQKGFSVEPQEIAEGLLKILKAGEDQIKIMQTHKQTMGNFPSDLKSLSTLKAQLDKKFADLKSKQDAARKAKAAAQKAEENLNKIRAKGKPDEIEKAESALSAANEKAINDQKAAEDEQADFETYFDDYKSKIVENFTTILSAMVGARDKTIRSLVEIAEQVSQSILEVKQPHDTVIDNLQKRLSDLDDEVIE